MGKTKAEVRAELLQAAEAEIEALLKWEDETVEVTITDIEEQVLAIRQRLSTRMTEMMVQQRATKADLKDLKDLNAPKNASGQRMHYKGKKQSLPTPQRGCEV